MKYLLVLFFLLQLIAFSPPPQVSITWGPEFEGSKKGSIKKTLGFDESGYYVVGYEGSDDKLIKLNNDLSVAATYIFQSRDKKEKLKYEFEAFRYFNDRLFEFTSYENHSTKKRELYIGEIDKSTLKQSGAPRKVGELTFKSFQKTGFFRIKTSGQGDKSKLMIAIASPTTDVENEKLTVIMLDDELKPIWQKEIEIPYNSELFVRSSFMCDDNGNAYMLGKVYNEKVKEKRNGKQNYTYHILAYTNQGENSLDYEIKLEDKFITDISYKPTASGDIVAGGFYSKKGTFSIDGAYYLLMDGKTKQIKESSFKEFDLDFISQGLTTKQEQKVREKDSKGSDAELANYELRELIHRNDGGTVLIGEQYYVSVHSTSFGFNGVYAANYSSDYYYNNIIVININNKGVIDWAQTIPKKQVSTNDSGMYSSFALAILNDKLHFIFNDNKENFIAKKQDEVKKYNYKSQDGVVVLATVGKDGTLIREILVNESDKEVVIRPKVSNQISDNEMLLFGERRKIDQFAILTFD